MRPFVWVAREGIEGRRHRRQALVRLVLPITASLRPVTKTASRHSGEVARMCSPRQALTSSRERT